MQLPAKFKSTNSQCWLKRWREKRKGKERKDKAVRQNSLKFNLAQKKYYGSPQVQVSEDERLNISNLE